jgi:DNA-directed RNA polymerase specialized sigma24 family protein
MTEAKTIEEAILSYRGAAWSIAAEVVRDPSLRADAVQEGLIQVWKVLQARPGVDRTYVYRAIKNRMRDISMRQTFTGYDGDRRRGIDPLRRPHSSTDVMISAGWEPVASASRSEARESSESTEAVLSEIAQITTKLHRATTRARRGSKDRMTAQAKLDLVLEIVNEWRAEYKIDGVVDAENLAYRLAQAGYPLTSTENAEN